MRAIKTNAVQLDLGAEFPFKTQSDFTPYVFGEIHSRNSCFREVFNEGYNPVPDRVIKVDAEVRSLGLTLGGGVPYRFNDFFL